MPIFKGQGCKSAPGKAIGYIIDEKKAALVSGQALDNNRSYAEQFRETGKLYGKGGDYDERKYYHFKFSCDPADGVTPEQSHKMAEEMAARSFHGHECVIATHTDKPHIHSHIVVNAVSFEDGKKLHLNNSEYGDLKDQANEIALEHGFTPLDWRRPSRDRVTSPEKQIVMRGGTSWKDELKDVIMEAVRQSGSFIEFRNHLEKYGVTIERNTEKTISFKHPQKEKAIRGNRLGDDFTKGAIMDAIDQQRNRRAASIEEPAADRQGEVARPQRPEPSRVRKQPAEREFDRVHGTIREVEERAKHLSPTGRAELAAREAAERAAAEAAAREREFAEERQRAIEQQHEQKHRGHDLGR